ncbi:topoisomerase DNA-binding C4 zinc finger domain-containing protein [Clostridium botulinum]|uniref:topoisomerase DNA-binding C4 zinc finger domain-containing protein n=1 Tax=Clostridium botulinum TaxID=1491 RepID=UPI001749DF98|nr:topoisomerase DNA-binding C4 zinc finger domain-containing protein [Clostridium botulinum]MBD5589258.1 topoisomerase DNA-binding C4 zinc finger domain-containing protein [Clostridium botulinum]
MYYKKMWEELKETIEYVAKEDSNNKCEALLKNMNDLEKKYDDYGDMNKYCSECGSKMITRKGKYGKFRGCSNYPRCNYHEYYKEFGKIKDNSNDVNINK